MEYYYDVHHLEEEEDYYEYEDFEDYQLQSDGDIGRSLKQTIEICVKPSLLQTSTNVLSLLGFSLLCRLMCSRLLVQKEWFQHIISILCGFGILYHTTGHEFLIVVFLTLMSYIFMLIVKYLQGNIGISMSGIAIMLHFIYELLWNQPESWQRIRGIQMITTMKIISLAYDLESSKVAKFENIKKYDDKLDQSSNTYSIPGLIPYLGYIFNPANCILGPWISFKAYKSGIRNNSINVLRSIYGSFLNAIIAVIFLTFSNCFVPFIFANKHHVGLLTYRDALSVRCSHYFICFLSQATLTIGGYQITEDTTSNSVFGQLVTKPWKIEYPRSLSSVVRAWNIPMHNWLKCYIYYPMNTHFKRYGLSIIVTYLVSSLLHGFHLRIYMVLLSLACLTYVENIFRYKMADIFNACITVNECRKPCDYKFCTNKKEIKGYIKLFVAFINCIFTILTICHLSYLGVMMSDDEDNKNDLRKWSQLNFFSHWTTVLIYIVYQLI